MALEISYWTGYDAITRLCYGRLISSESMTLSAASSNSGTIPANSAVARLTAGENCRISNNGSAASATNGVYLGAGESMDLSVSDPSVTQIKALTA